MFEAAVPLPKALELLDTRLVGPRLAAASQDANARLLRGSALHEAMAAQGNAFSSLQVQLVRLGTETGSLHHILHSLADHEERRSGLAQQLKAALFYPCVVFLSCLVFLLFVPPLMFKGLLQLLTESGQELPALTRAVASLSRSLSEPWTYLLLALLGFGVWRVGKAVFSGPASRLAVLRQAERLPGLGPVLVSARLAQFTSALALVLSSGLRLDRGLGIVCRSCESLLLEQAEPEMVEGLRQGEALSVLLCRSQLFPKMVWQSVASGEDSGNLPQMLDFLSRFYRSDLEYRLTSLAALLEPLVLGIMGLLVGALMIACIKPLAASFAQF